MIATQVADQVLMIIIVGGSEDSNDSFADQVRRVNEELKQKRGEHDGNQIIGPMPLIIDNLNHRVNYGKELLPGEGAAIAYYI